MYSVEINRFNIYNSTLRKHAKHKSARGYKTQCVVYQIWTEDYAGFFIMYSVAVVKQVTAVTSRLTICTHNAMRRFFEHA